MDIKTTPSYSTTVMDEALVVYIEGKKGVIENDLTKLHESIIFKGSKNQLKSSRIYNEKFVCVFNLQHFPFDKQVCHITFSLVPQQTTVAMLLPKCLWTLPINSDNTRVRYCTRLSLSNNRYENQWG